MPIIKQLDVQIEDFDLIPGNEIPRFSMQSSKATELLQGSGIYNNKFIFARELLQNSIDATLLRIFIENKSDIRTDDISSFRDICNSKKQNYRILFKIDTDKNDDSILHISIEDQGIGIDSEDLKYILSSGEKGKNPFVAAYRCTCKSECKGRRYGDGGRSGGSCRRRAVCKHSSIQSPILPAS